MYQRTVAPVSLDTTSSEPITQSLLSSLLLVLRRIGLTSPASPPPHAHHHSHQAVYAAARNLLPELSQMAASLGCHAGLAASLIPVMMRLCHLSPSGSIPVISKHLHLVQAMYHAFHVRSVALREHHSQAQQAQGASEATPGAMAENFESANADLEGTLEGSLLAMALHLAQDAPGAQMLLDQGVADFLPALAKWLLSPDSAGQSFPCLHVEALGLHVEAQALTDSLTMQQMCQLQHRLCDGQSPCTFLAAGCNCHARDANYKCFTRHSDPHTAALHTRGMTLKAHSLL